MFDYKLLIFFVTNLIILRCVPLVSALKENDSTLQLVHILFRHGERTPEKSSIYPKDPHINETYYPYGHGELTNKGKQTEYKLGKLLRQRYDKFLGKIYTPDILEAFSSNTNRTKTSLQLVLAGLFPPVEEQIWDASLNWQPIPFNAVPRQQDQLFFGLFCPRFKELYYGLINSPKFVQEFEENAEIFQYLSENTGLNVQTYWDVFFLFMCLKTEEEYGLKLPEWTKNVYPDVLEEFAHKGYELLTATTELRRLTSGSLLKKIVDDSLSKISNELSPKSRKIFLYSGHELNIAHLFLTLEIFKPHIPPYGSYVIFELHRVDNVYGFKIFYQNYSSEKPQLLKLPACEEFCRLDKFISLVEEYFPTPNFCGNEM